MSRKENDDFVATKAEKTFDDDGNTLVAEVDKKTTLKEALGNKKGYVTKTNNKKPFKIKKILLDNSAKVIKLK
jgi:hypothetical protein|tara:strand:+ start:6108 stop:6326 length:219 start_codon:yes stop_codon:yes gene_type:complete